MFTRSKTEAATADTVSTPRRDHRDAPSIISGGAAIKGDMTSSGDIQLDGTIKGDIRCGSLTVGDSGRVDGNIRAETVAIRGTVKGTICANTIRLEKSARMTGDLTHRSLSVEAGARIDGRIIHRDKPLDGDAEPERAKPATSGVMAKAKPSSSEETAKSTEKVAAAVS